MVKYYEIKSVRDGRMEVLGTFEPLEAGIIIKWGGDSQEPDGLKQWEVIREF